MWKRVGLVLLLTAALSVTACSANQRGSGENGEGQDEKLKVAFVVPGSISDGAFGTISYQGIQGVKKEPYIERADYVEGINAVTDASKAIRDYVAFGYDVVWAQSGAHGAALMEIAPDFPDSVFVTLASPSEGETYENVCFNIVECEGAYYVAGALAALETKSDVIGFVGGRENPLYVACSKAYEEGAKSVNPHIKMLSVFTGDFNDPIKAKEATASQIQGGADVIVHLQDLGMTGVFAAAEEATASGEQVWVIGKGSDQHEQAPDVVMTSIVFDYGAQMKTILSDIAQGARNGEYRQSLETGSIYLADFHGTVSEEVEQKIAELTEKVKAGEVTYTTQYDIK